MAQGGVPGKGVRVAYSASSPITWTRVRQVLDVSVPRDVSERWDITTHDTASRRKTYMPGNIETEDPVITTLSDWDPSTGTEQEAMRRAQKDGTVWWWRFELPTNRERTLFRGLEFQASIKDFAPAAPIGGAQTTAWTLIFEGDDIGVDLAAGASEIS